MEFRLTIFNKRILFRLSARDIRKKDVAGYTNRCSDGKYIVMMDYDAMEYEWVYKELKFIQNEFNLGAFHIIQNSENSYHAICVDKVNIRKYLDILRSSSVDPNYINIPFNYGKKLWTLRVTSKNNNKPSYKGLIKGDNKVRAEVSTPHIKLLQLIFGVSDFDMRNRTEDMQDDLILAKYKI